MNESMPALLAMSWFNNQYKTVGPSGYKSKQFESINREKFKSFWNIICFPCCTFEVDQKNLSFDLKTLYYLYKIFI